MKSDEITGLCDGADPHALEEMKRCLTECNRIASKIYCTVVEELFPRRGRVAEDVAELANAIRIHLVHVQTMLCEAHRIVANAQCSISDTDIHVRSVLAAVHDALPNQFDIRAVSSHVFETNISLPPVMKLAVRDVSGLLLRVAGIRSQCGRDGRWNDEDR